MPSISKSHVHSLLAPPGTYFDYSGESNFLLIQKLKRRKLHFTKFRENKTLAKISELTVVIQLNNTLLLR